jgi:hypothetical protein
MGIWIELGIFLLVFVFAYFQLKELKQEKLKPRQVIPGAVFCWVKQFRA